jgi:hypothetical protein
MRGTSQVEGDKQLIRTPGTGYDAPGLMRSDGAVGYNRNACADPPPH